MPRDREPEEENEGRPQQEEGTRSQIGELRDEIKKLEANSAELTNRVRDLVEGVPAPETGKAELEPTKHRSPLLFEVDRIRHVNTRLRTAIERIKGFGV